ncbi:cell wall-binding repeat-containing protein [Herbiconiux sp. CPCC 205716]|uniref:Cell wall-binding repeat-containing protein n=1 Tax=Herbiconiux gentiana TaxID=2970912 RepID=A0ABT2GE76_9MICO|nr:cell wall-binding repeat-containing protein [Herbiconiux gentiana]MCS5713131.1 cell wall-binding repeat-containing protein [Herbiconiux gentiana]
MLYPKAAQLPNGRLIAAFERSLGNPVGQTMPLYSSDDYGSSWQKLSDLASPAAMTEGTDREASFAKYTSNWTNPYLYTLPTDVGDLKAGTLLLASLVSGADQYYAEQKALNPDWTPVRDGDRENAAIALYASTDGNGEQWQFLNIIAEGGWTGSYGTLENMATENVYQQNDPVWEPYLMEYEGQLVAYYTDEVDYTGFDPETGVLQRDPNWQTHPDTVNQILAHRLWDGTASGTWSEPIADEVGSPTVDKTGTTILGGGRPGMTNVVPTTDGKWLLTAEFGVTKISDDPLRFWDAPYFQLNGARASNNPVLVKVPNPTDPTKWSLIFNDGDTGSNILVNESGRSDGQWLPYQTSLPAGYSRNLTFVPQTGRVVVLRGGWGGSPISYSEVDLGHSQGAYYSVVNRKTGQVLSTEFNKTQDPIYTGDTPDIVSRPDVPGNDTQRWHLTAKGTNVTLLNKGGGRAAGLWQGSASAGASLSQWVDDGGSDKVWTLVPTDDGFYRFQSSKNESLYMTGSDADGRITVQQAAAQGDLSQDWQLIQEAPAAADLVDLYRAPGLATLTAETLQLSAPASDPAGTPLHAIVSGHVYAYQADGSVRNLGTASFDADQRSSLTVDPADVPAGSRIAVVFDSGPLVWDTLVAPAAPLVDRIAGADRYEVSVNTAKAGFPDGASTVYVASGEGFPDALSAAPAATLAGGPILLTTGRNLPAAVRDEVARLAPDAIVIVGGSDSVSTAVQDTLAEIAPVSRIGGADRFETSRNVADSTFAEGADVAVISTGASFPDALSAGSAVSGRGPVILVDGSKSGLDEATRALLTRLGISSVVIAGGPSSVSPGIESDAAEMATTVRLGGADRYDTARQINAYFIQKADRVVLATGEKFPDALSGSAFAPTVDAPLFTVPSTCIPSATLSQIAALGASSITLLGGPAALSPAVENLTPCA